MKVLYCAPHDYFAPGASESYDYFNSIRSLGHEVEPFFYRRKSFFYSNFRGAWIRRMNRRLLERARAFDLLFVFRGGYVEADTLERIRGGGRCRAVCFLGDNPYGAGNPPVEFQKIGAYDLFVVKDTYFRDELALFGFDNVVFMPHSYDPEFYEKPIPEEELAPYAADVTFIGGHYGYRERFFSRLTDDGVRLRLWGPRWDQARDPWIRERVGASRGVYGEEKLKIARAGKIFLSLINGGNSVRCPDDKPVIYSGAGAFVMTNHKPDMELVFTPGEEIVTFRSREELQGLIRRYLADGEARAAIARRARERARREHTAAARFRQILETLAQRGVPAGGGKP
ncbi:MAG: hypothetical protein A3J27_12230 [Candidatus Tectomicrobia bacterium RIFCSPLOWO2_12_FULL_69_37]|nr:MAG: hypothetical protein A3J27_12230 [Candidatus Tectomicrobia bacterium RIFCSPLOWO2_12_FULL_69_37]